MRRKRSGLTLVGASVGDAACFVITPDEGAVAVTKWHRTEANPKDSGGELMMSIGVQGSVTAFMRVVTPRDLVLLATDGLTDNVLRCDMGRILPLIVRSTFFQSAVEKQYPARHSRLPTYRDLAALCQDSPLQSLLQVSPANAVRRITNYLHWVTRSLYKQEQRYYALELAVKKISDLDDKARALDIITDTLRRYPLREESAASGNSGPLAAGLASSIKSRPRQRSETGEEYQDDDDDDDDDDDSTGAGASDEEGDTASGAAAGDGSREAAAARGGGSRRDAAYQQMRSSTKRCSRASLLEELGKAHDVAQMVSTLQGHLRELQQARKLHRSAGKTDDAMVVVFRPLQKRAL